MNSQFDNQCPTVLDRHDCHVNYEKLICSSDSTFITTQSIQLEGRIDEIHERFDHVITFLDEQDDCLHQLAKQYENSRGILTSFENFLDTFNRAKPNNSSSNQLSNFVFSLKHAFEELSVNGYYLTEKMNNRMKDLFNEFVKAKKQLAATDDPSKVSEMAAQIDIVYHQLDVDEENLEYIENYVKMELREQRFLISQFIEAMGLFCKIMHVNVVWENLVYFKNANPQFVPYNNLQFLHDLIISCQNIQIV